MSHDYTTPLPRRETDSIDEFTLFVHHSEQIFDRMLAVLEVEKLLDAEHAERRAVIKELRDMYSELKDRVRKVEAKVHKKGDAESRQALVSIKKKVGGIGKRLMREVAEAERVKRLGSRELAAMRDAVEEAMNRRDVAGG